MRLTIWKKIVFFLILPFAVIYLVLFSIIIYQVYEIHQKSLPDIVHVIVPVVILFFMILLFYIALYLFLKRRATIPLAKITSVSQEIASGNLDVDIEITRSGDEVETITSAVWRMAEQFRVSKIIQERYRERIALIMSIHTALFHGDTLSQAFDEALTALAEYFGIYKAALVLIREEKPIICSVYPVIAREEGDSEFFSHHQVVQLLKGKKILSMNYGTLAESNLSFVSYETKALCLLPLRVNAVLRGYIILEGKKESAFVHDDTTMLFLGITLSNIISRRSEWELAATNDISLYKHITAQDDIQLPENSNDFLEKAKNIQDLNVEKGILLIGGEKEKYSELIRVTIKVIADGIQKMREIYTEDLSAFAIEIHGMKAALYCIGAEVWGDEARQLEFAAKSNDADYCKSQYPLFEEKLRTLSRNLAALFPQKERDARPGNCAELAETLHEIRENCNKFDSIAAISLLSPFLAYKWEDEGISELLMELEKDLDNLEYEVADTKILKLQEKLDGNTV